jgi:hypothetical protein
MSVPTSVTALPVELVSQGAYGYAPSVSASWPPLGNGETVLCRVCPYGPTPMGGRVNRHLSQRRLVALLREATGIDEVEPDRRPWTGATVRLDTAIRTKSTQRISLQQQDDSLALSTFPGELKPQAEALYRTGRAQRLMDFVAEHPGAWQAMPSVLKLCRIRHSAAPWAYRDLPVDDDAGIHRAAVGPIVIGGPCTPRRAPGACTSWRSSARSMLPTIP